MSKSRRKKKHTKNRVGKLQPSIPTQQQKTPRSVENETAKNRFFRKPGVRVRYFIYFEASPYCSLFLTHSLRSVHSQPLRMHPFGALGPDNAGSIKRVNEERVGGLGWSRGFLCFSARPIFMPTFFYEPYLRSCTAQMHFRLFVFVAVVKRLPCASKRATEQQTDKIRAGTLWLRLIGARS